MNIKRVVKSPAEKRLVHKFGVSLRNLTHIIGPQVLSCIFEQGAARTMYCSLLTVPSPHYGQRPSQLPARYVNAAIVLPLKGG